ncbi:MAG TPA: diversity-generating retroelement protein Avd [Victivallales bacterium]|nr:diversity-generating retroelement protein Avd [Victivallales bacterium]
MSEMDKLILYQKVYDLTLYSFPIINRFPKNQRFVLGQQIQNCMIDISKLIVHANKLRNKKEKLYEVDIELEKLRFLIRLSKDLRIMPVKKYGNCIVKIEEIGKILGGILKYVQG